MTHLVFVLVLVVMRMIIGVRLWGWDWFFYVHLGNPNQIYTLSYSKFITFNSPHFIFYPSYNKLHLLYLFYYLVLNQFIYLNEFT